MTMQVIECQQGTPEWFAARLGIPTASKFSAVLAKGEGKTRASYMRELASEIITGEVGESFQSMAMERGKQMEAEARDLYAFVHDAPLTQVGFIRNGDRGCSPDSLVGDKGGVEIKTQRADLLIETLLRGTFPPEHKAQCQGFLWVAEREWVDLVVYWPRMPLFVSRAYRDEEYIRALSDAVDAFNADLAAMVKKVRAYK
jgi:hypothetical protein